MSVTGRQTRTTAFLCDTAGEITRIIRDDLGICRDGPSGVPLCELVDADTKERAELFLATLKDRKVVLDWPLNVSSKTGVAMLRFCGVRGDEEALVVASESRPAVGHLDAELTRVPWREAGAMRSLLRERCVEAIDELAIEQHLYDELTRVNNELVTIQRELTKKNAELRLIGESRRRKAEEARLRQVQVLEQVHDAVIATDLDGVVQVWNQGAERLYGYEPSEAVGRNIEFVYGERGLALLRDQVGPERRGPVESVLRTRRKSGEEIQVAVRSSLLRDAADRANGIITCSNDITVQKQAEEALRGLAGRLLRAREEERRRIARELHDDINQRLAAMAMTLSRMKQAVRPSEDELYVRVGELHEQTIEVSHDVRRLSHRLHPAMMEHVGLAAALRSFCTEFGKSENLEIRVSLTDELGTLDPDVALTLYRVAQESLRNVAKHSRASKAEVSLDKLEDGVHLSISDNGSGFDEQEVRRRKGLGIASMEERVRLLKGHFWVESDPGGGTLVQVKIPLMGG